jgi:hypothetical protein
VANGVVEACWLQQLLQELYAPLMKSTLIYCNNVCVVYLSTNPIQHQHTKHVEIDSTLCGNTWPSVMSAFCTYQRHPNSRTSSRRVFLIQCFQSFSTVSTFAVARVSTVGEGVLETCCIIGTWVQDHLLCEAWPDPLGLSPRVAARVFLRCRP